MGRSSYRSKKKQQELNEQKLRRLILNTTTQNHNQTPPTDESTQLVEAQNENSPISPQQEVVCQLQMILPQPKPWAARTQAKERLLTLLKSLSTNLLDIDEPSAILDETRTLCTIEGIHSIEKFLIPFIENTKSLKERRDHALDKIMGASTNLSQIQQLKSKLESHTKGKLNADDSEADLNQVISTTTASITEIEEKIAKLQASKQNFEELLQTVEDIHRLRKEAPEIMAANMELELIQLESKDIENKALFFIKMVEKL